ncbi:SH3 domain-containing protein [Ponticoccus sp. (in: a-proteobacteria)]|uniref:SH3 domain-containing protein n=1 Tax=Ponticoccus sp. (in: a-proteobacteria) TaxID=1925025 RepID=UPI003AB81956
MFRVMLITFGVLGWAWYELSGGSEFEAGDTGVTLMAAVPDTALGATPGPEVTRADRSASDLSSVAPVREAAAPVRQPLPEPAKAVIAAEPVVPADPQKFAALLDAALPDEPEGNFDDAPVAEVMPVAGTARPAVAEPVVAETAFAEPSVAEPAIAEPQRADLRVVVGSRVNLREGPATSYAVVTQLLQGEFVEVLDETGDGWVRLRAVDGNNEGWMAASLLVASN